MDNFGSPGQCAQCSAPILWTRSSSDPNRWNRPLDMMSSVKRFAVINGHTVYTDTYVNHLCSRTPPEEDIQQSDGQLEKLMAQLTRAEENAAWLSVECPVKECAAEVSEPCIRIHRLYRNGSRSPENYPHAARRLLGIETQGLMDRSPVSRSQYADMVDRGKRRIEDEIQWGKRDRRLDEQRAAAIERIVAKTKCERCGASRGVQCWNLTQRNKGVKEHTENPHVERRNAYSARRKKD